MHKGKLQENILIRSLLKNITPNKEVIGGAAVGSQCTILNDRINTIGYVANEKMLGASMPIHTPLGHSILRAANHMAASKGDIETISLSLSLPENFSEKKMREMIQDGDRICLDLGCRIIGGHTEIVASLDRPIVTAFATGRYKKTESDKTTPLSEMSIIMTKWIGISGAVVATAEHSMDLAQRLPHFLIEDVLDLEQFISIIPEANIGFNEGCHYMHSVSDGGIMAALWQLGEYLNVGIEADLKSIPVRQEIIEVAEAFDINPYKWRSDGALLMVTDNPDKLLRELWEADIAAAIIGKTTCDSAKKLKFDEETRFLEQPLADEGAFIEAPIWQKN